MEKPNYIFVGGHTVPATHRDRWNLLISRKVKAARIIIKGIDEIEKEILTESTTQSAPY